MGGESTEAWRTVLDDLVKRGLRRPEFLIVDGASGLDMAIAAVWGDVPVQRCTVHKHRNLLAHAPERLHDEIAADYNAMLLIASSTFWPSARARTTNAIERLLQAVGDGTMLEPPFADEGLTAHRDLLPRGRVERQGQLAASVCHPSTLRMLI